MVSLFRSATLLGVDAQSVEIEVEFAAGLPLFNVIGMGDTAVQESRFRIQSALRAAGIELPRKRITINLAPAALRKDGAALDLPMALGVLVAAGILAPEPLRSAIAVGELALDGRLRPVRGALPIAALAQATGFHPLIVPAENAIEAALIPNLGVRGAPDLPRLIAHLRDGTALPPLLPGPEPETGVLADLDEVRGQLLARRALEIAAAGAHNILLVGPPGSGKTMLARRLPGILPPMTAEEQIDVTKIWSAAGRTVGVENLRRDRPFCAPHHTISEAGLIGGGSTIRPGEVSLAHRGVLFLDELPELPRRVLESLRQPLEDGFVTIARAKQSVRLPAAFQLIGAANPCPCGWLGTPKRNCSCAREQLERYTRRLSGPILDRIDLIVEVPSLGAEALFEGGCAESSSAVQQRVVTARMCAHRRGVLSNRELKGRSLSEAAALDAPAKKLLLGAIEKFELSARAIDRTRRVARTIADLRAEPEIGVDAVAEALRYRPPAGWAQRAT